MKRKKEIFDLRFMIYDLKKSPVIVIPSRCALEIENHKSSVTNF
jgi:hypothetical protein